MDQENNNSSSADEDPNTELLKNFISQYVSKKRNNLARRLDQIEKENAVIEWLFQQASQAEWHGTEEQRVEALRRSIIDDLENLQLETERIERFLREVDQCQEDVRQRIEHIPECRQRRFMELLELQEQCIVSRQIQLFERLQANNNLDQLPNAAREQEMEEPQVQVPAQEQLIPAPAPAPAQENENVPENIAADEGVMDRRIHPDPDPNQPIEQVEHLDWGEWFQIGERNLVNINNELVTDEEQFLEDQEAHQQERIREIFRHPPQRRRATIYHMARNVDSQDIQNFMNQIVPLLTREQSLRLIRRIMSNMRSRRPNQNPEPIVSRQQDRLRRTIIQEFLRGKLANNQRNRDPD